MKEIKPEALQGNPFTLIGSEWMLITAGNKEHHNMMTASWGGLGVLWEKNVATVYVRPTRYTLGFLKNEPYFTLSFFGKNKAVHKICGSKSGRDIDKTAALGLTPVYENGAVYFKEAELVIVCKKLYADAIKPECFIDPAVNNFYTARDYHEFFIGEIVKVYVSENR